MLSRSPAAFTAAETRAANFQVAQALCRLLAQARLLDGPGRVIGQHLEWSELLRPESVWSPRVGVDGADGAPGGAQRHDEATA